MSETEQIIRKHALANAAQFGGKASMGAVIGKVIAEKPELKVDMNALKQAVTKIISEVNALDLETQKKELEKTGWQKIEKEQREGLPPLPNADTCVVMRMAPNPNGPLHIGHARMVILNDEYAKMYRGKLFLRFDDTDPKNPNKVPMKAAYKWIENDLKWLGVKYGKVFSASSRLPIYYKYFEKNLEAGNAYVCTCEQEAWSRMVRNERKPCPCKDLDAEENLKRWRNMLKHKLKEGQAVGRIKTDMDKIKDPAVIDWVAFRIVDKPQHPFSGKPRKKVWPMLDFASAIDDREFGITHIVRGKDLAISEARQRILYEYMGWKYPVAKIYGKIMTTEEMVVSKSKIAEGIKSGKFSGYDDPQLATLSAFRKRGILPEAIRNYMVGIGMNESETTVDLEILYAENRKLIDKTSDRYFFVAEPVEIELDKVPAKVVKAPLYPGGKKFRRIPATKKIFVEKADFDADKGKEARLMHFCNIILDKKAKVTGSELKDARKAKLSGMPKTKEVFVHVPKLHWVPKGAIKTKLVMPDGKIISGLAEPAAAKIKPNQIVQFERVGFARCDKKGLFYFAHK
ncbi:MAG: glutamate--tRNA ligase [Candidatus Aenigmatarchaeota archaeon]